MSRQNEMTYICNIGGIRHERLVTMMELRSAVPRVHIQLIRANVSLFYNLTSNKTCWHIATRTAYVTALRSLYLFNQNENWGESGQPGTMSLKILKHSIMTLLTSLYDSYRYPMIQKIMDVFFAGIHHETRHIWSNKRWISLYTSISFSFFFSTVFLLGPSCFLGLGGMLSVQNSTINISFDCTRLQKMWTNSTGSATEKG